MGYLTEDEIEDFYFCVDPELQTEFEGGLEDNGLNTIFEPSDDDLEQFCIDNPGVPQVEMPDRLKMLYQIEPTDADIDTAILDLLEGEI